MGDHTETSKPRRFAGLPREQAITPIVVITIRQESAMLRWALIFLVLGLIAALFGFTSIAGTSIAIAKVLFFIFLAIFAVMLILGLTVYRGVRGP
jgi:uncharacterized membrane protein YtjA (UPF0391 family)